MAGKGLHNSSDKSALTQPNIGSMGEGAMDASDVLLYPKPDGSRPVSSGFPMENSPKG